MLIINRDRVSSELALDDALMLDVRDPDELVSRRRARVRDAWLWRPLVASLVLLLLAGLGEGALVGLDMLQQGRIEQIAGQTPIVNEIETAHRLANRIDELRTKRLRPFEMIALVDQPQPESIVFRRTTATSLYSLEIEAETASSPDINAYITALTALEGTENVEMLNLETRGARSTLRLVVTFALGAFDVQQSEPTLAEPGEVSS